MSLRLNFEYSIKLRISKGDYVSKQIQQIFNNKRDYEANNRSNNKDTPYFISLLRLKILNS